MDKDQALEDMMGKLGDFGRYQCFQFMLHILSALTAGMHMLSLVTVAAVPEHRCAINEVDTFNYTEPWNSSLVLAAIPKNSHGSLEKCTVIGANETLEQCSSWIYDMKYFTSSRGIEWDFVCDRRWMGAFAQTAYMLGVVVGALVLGRLCDRYGRKKIFLLSGFLQLLFGVSVAFTVEYYSFLVLRFLYGVFGSGSYIAGYVLSMEIVGQTKRTICGVTFQILYAVGIMLLALWGYLIDNRFYLQIVYGLHATILLPHAFLMDESPRWLWAQGRARESVAIIEKALKMNKSNEILDVPTLVSNCKVTTSKYSEDDSSAGTFDLFKTPNMLKKTLIICGCWFANSVVYSGLALNTGELKGNPYFVLFLLGVVELPAYVIILYFLDRVGHRALISAMMLLGGVSCLVVAGLPSGSMSTGVVMVGKLFISGSYSIVYKYSAELFPTVVRSSGVGLGTMSASISGAFSPLIVLLDTLNPKIPTVIFGLLALLSGGSMLALPETVGRRLPQSLEDGEKFGVGDTCFTNCRGRRMSEDSVQLPETMVPLEVIEKKS